MASKAAIALAAAEEALVGELRKFKQNEEAADEAVAAAEVRARVRVRSTVRVAEAPTSPYISPTFAPASPLHLPISPLHLPCISLRPR